MQFSTESVSRVDHPEWLGVLWGKSNAGGRPNLLAQHLLDTAAVGELVWDRFLAPAIVRAWDETTRGRGREIFTLLCAVHDVGKVSPAFQSKVPELAAHVRAAGLGWGVLNRADQRWHHTVAGARILRSHAREIGMTPETCAWVWPFIAGHHGKVPSAAKLSPPGRGAGHGVTAAWSAAQQAMVRFVTEAVGVDPVRLGDVHPASRAAQLALLGALVMADWVASNADHFPGVDSWRDVGMAAARERASSGWTALGLRGGWSHAALGEDVDPVRSRFGFLARPGQAIVTQLARSMPAPGLLIVEAPMGEGKTEAALAAAEVLARRFGADGLFVGMPTQATSDPMFTRVREWAEQIDPTAPVALLHGKARFNPVWRDLLRRGVRIAGVDEYGCADEYGSAAERDPAGPEQAPAEWFLGAKRGLLTPLVVGTVDQLLHAATRTRHVMLRHTGLAGKVVILDEVHAYDVYMAQFLHEALRWLAQAGVPVVLLSATLPPQMRAALARSYLQGARGTRDVDVSDLPPPNGYPAVTSICAVDGESRWTTQSAESWRASLHAAVDVLPEPSNPTSDPVVGVLADRLADGGCALVVRNTVARAQATYGAARQAFGADAVLLHGRLTARERADRTQRVLDQLGPPGAASRTRRPRRLVVVATQLAEQSFDVDVDLLVTDLAPIDLLLQRAGRLHRHERPLEQRPAAVRAPRVVVTGVRLDPGAPPTLPAGSRHVYGDLSLLRAAALVQAATGTGWAIPVDVPRLVRQGYSEDCNLRQEWTQAAAAASEEQRSADLRRRSRAADFLLSGEDDLGAPTLAGLHERSVADLDDEDVVRAVVRDGEPSLEVILVRGGPGQWRMLDGRPLGATGEAVSDPDVLESVVGDVVRLPAQPDLTARARSELLPLPGWSGNPWLARALALPLDDSGDAMVGRWRLHYDDDLGLTAERTGQR